MSLSRFFVRSAPLARSAQRSLFSVQAAAGKVSEALGEEPDENNTTPLDADEQMRKEILAEHPHENAEDVIAAYSAPRNVMQPIIGAFGVRKRPTLVPSGYDSRIVACTGGASLEPGYGVVHEAAWLVVRDDGKKYACDECGQVFKLLRLKGTRHSHDAHH